MRRRWNRLNQLRIRKWIKRTTYAFMLLFVLSIVMAVVGASIYVSNMHDCTPKAVQVYLGEQKC